MAGTINDRGRWWHKLSRSAFAFSDVHGLVDTLELRGNNKRETYSFADDSTWHIPEIGGFAAYWSKAMKMPISI